MATAKVYERRIPCLCGDGEFVFTTTDYNKMYATPDFDEYIDCNTCRPLYRLVRSGGKRWAVRLADSERIELPPDVISL